MYDQNAAAPTATQQHLPRGEISLLRTYSGRVPLYRNCINLSVYCRYSSGETFQGRWTAEGDTSAVVIMVWDNSYSCLRPKTLAYKVCPCYLRYQVLDGLVELWQCDGAELCCPDVSSTHELFCYEYTSCVGLNRARVFTIYISTPGAKCD